MSANLPGGGTFKLDGKIGRLDTADASLTPLDAKVIIKGLDLAKTGFVDPSTGISGIADLENTLASKSGVAHAQGSATLTKLQLVKGGAPSSIPVLVDFIVDYNLANSTGTLTQGAIKIGKAVTHVSGTFDNRGNDVMLNLKVDGQNLPVTDLEAALPAFVPAIGQVTGAGTVSNSGALNFNMVANLSSSGAVGGAVGEAMGCIPGLQKVSGGGGLTKVPFAIQGTTSDPKFVPNVGAMATAAASGIAQQATP